jgi:heptosyltransferase-1
VNLQLPSEIAGIDRFLIVRLGSMGDIIHTLPAVTALREAYPKAILGWVVEERWSELLCSLSEERSGSRSALRPLVDRLHLVNTKAWRTSLLSKPTLREIVAALRSLRAMKYQVAIDFQGAARSALIARSSGAETVFGSSQPREGLASMFYTRQVASQSQHVVEQNLSLSEAVAKKRLHTPKVEFPHDSAAEAYCQNLLREYGLADFVVMNPGAGWGAKQWPAERYGEVARRLAEWGLPSLINFGPGEGILARAVEATSEGTAQSISCSLSQLIALTRRASLFIGGDTGPMHLAAALNVPVVALFGPTNPLRNGPFGTESIVLRSNSSVTSHARRKEPEAGLLEITADQVVTAAKKLLGGPRNAKLV